MFYRPNHAGGIDVQNKFGSNFDISASELPQDIWDCGGIYPFPIASGPTTLVSDSPEDAPGGTGVWTVTVFGLDHNLLLLKEVKEPNGLTDVLLDNEFYRVFRVNVEEAGSHETNIGTIEVKHGTTILARVQPDNGSTLMAIYTVSLDYKSCFLTGFYLEIGRVTGEGNITVDAQFQVRKPGGAWQVKRPVTIGLKDESIWRYQFADPGMPIAPGSDLRWRVLDVNSGTALAHAGFDLREIR